MKRGTRALILGLLIGAGLGGALGAQAYRGWREHQQARLELARRRASWDRLKQAVWQEIRAFRGESAVWIEDLGTGWVAAHREEKPFPAASVVKVPILVACLQRAEEGELDLSEVVTLKGRDKADGSGVLKEMPNGARVSVGELVELMVTQSDNTAANLLISRIGMEPLNRSFLEMGLGATRLSRRMMDFSQRKKGVENWTTAKDVSLVFRRIYRGERMSPGVSRRCLELLEQQKVNDRIPALLPAGTVVAHKTGLEKGVCHDSGIVFTENGAVLVCVLTRNGSQARPAKRFISRVAARAFGYLAQDYGG
ncbi:MAG: serine hydrolase [Candidatus Omnitrophica bacterium]|nr:serine hydrolase [Candidatus Omnitrophota bacterium]